MKRSETEELSFRLKKAETYNRLLIMRLKNFGVSGIINLRFDESEHPRDDEGKFKDKPKKTYTSDEIEKIKKDIGKIGIKGVINIPPKKIDTSKLSIDVEHITDRGHNVTLDEVISYIKNASVSITKWNGTFEKFFSDSGAAYVDMKKGNIKTSFKSKEYDEHTLKLMEVLNNYGE